MYDVPAMRELLERAGALAMRHFLRVTPSWKANATYVTEADLAVQAFLKEELVARFPDDGIVAEEAQLRKEPRAGDRYWVVDPIDGTASFVAGLPAWGIALGLLAGDEPVAGFFWMPVSKDFFHTRPDGGAYRNDRRARIKALEPLHSESVLLAHSRLHHGYAIAPGFPGKVRGMGSAVAHLCYVATGSADAALMGHEYVWDLAAGAALLHRTGGVLKYLDGPPVSLGALLRSGGQAPYPMLAGHPEAVARFESLITYVAPSPVEGSESPGGNA